MRVWRVGSAKCLKLLIFSILLGNQLFSPAAYGRIKKGVAYAQIRHPNLSSLLEASKKSRKFCNSTFYISGLFADYSTRPTMVPRVQP